MPHHHVFSLKFVFRDNFGANKPTACPSSLSHSVFTPLPSVHNVLVDSEVLSTLPKPPSPPSFITTTTRDTTNNGTENGTQTSLPLPMPPATNPNPTGTATLTTSIPVNRTENGTQTAPLLPPPLLSPSSTLSRESHNPSNGNNAQEANSPGHSNHLEIILPVALSVLVLLALGIISCRKRRRAQLRNVTYLEDDPKEVGWEDIVKFVPQDDVNLKECGTGKDASGNNPHTKTLPVSDLEMGPGESKGFLTWSISTFGIDSNSVIGISSASLNLVRKDSTMMHDLGRLPISRANSTTPTLVSKNSFSITASQIQIHVHKQQEYFSDADIRPSSRVSSCRQSPFGSTPSPNFDTMPPPFSPPPCPVLLKGTRALSFSPSDSNLRSNMGELIGAQGLGDTRKESSLSHSPRSLEPNISLSPSSLSPSPPSFSKLEPKQMRGFDTIESESTHKSDYSDQFESDDPRRFSHNSSVYSESSHIQGNKSLGLWGRMKSGSETGEGSSGLNMEEKNEIAFAIHNANSSDPYSFRKFNTRESDDIPKQLDSNSTYTFASITPSSPSPSPLFGTLTLSFFNPETTVTSFETFADNGRLSGNLVDNSLPLEEPCKPGGGKSIFYEEEKEDGRSRDLLARYSPDLSIKTVYAL